MQKLKKKKKRTRKTYLNLTLWDCTCHRHILAVNDAAQEMRGICLMHWNFYKLYICPVQFHRNAMNSGNILQCDGRAWIILATAVQLLLLRNNCMALFKQLIKQYFFMTSITLICNTRHELSDRVVPWTVKLACSINRNTEYCSLW